MNRLMLPVMGTLLLCAQSFSAWAADSTSTTTAGTSAEQVREQMEAKRDQLSGVAKLTQTPATSSATVQDTPVVTDDAPTQVQQQ